MRETINNNREISRIDPSNLEAGSIKEGAGFGRVFTWIKLPFKLALTVICFPFKLILLPFKLIGSVFKSTNQEELKKEIKSNNLNKTPLDQAQASVTKLRSVNPAKASTSNNGTIEKNRLPEEDDDHYYERIRNQVQEQFVSNIQNMLSQTDITFTKAMADDLFTNLRANLIQALEPKENLEHQTPPPPPPLPPIGATGTKPSFFNPMVQNKDTAQPKTRVKTYGQNQNSKTPPGHKEEIMRRIQRIPRSPTVVSGN